MLLIALIQSCTVEKRLYNRGFHVEWKKRFKKNDHSIVTEKKLVKSEGIKEEFVSEGYIIEHSPEQASDSLQIRNPGKQIGQPAHDQSMEVKKEPPFSFSKQSKTEKKVPGYKRLLKASRGGFLRSVFAVLLIILILPLFFLVIFSSGVSLDLILLWLFGILMVALIIFFIVRMILTAVRY